ncbi:MAG: crossover junction endodeoxyribonuclease RuvC [Armatimonadota bacterium]|nr:crossover junction endodeoxyribonuclease RuvC [Armatimonadota bacterium]MDR7422811.1 crossover junction endodeoxyribonuclease RuvC [Armatimonadota bacterium]MDR7453329.1 crossover junction endodeoxyribonuclease RuvC [Armatimonadota bacterium]MDR7456472.1 crossover junction endodeoxyribonuclease RuvC [Armatimonadota bacterium]MDR7496261.1 crossover junction endodeoxyribonuclease RuvC [Armatimonadota bacterium]
MLGLDPGLRRTGYGALFMEDGRPRIREAGVLATPARGDLGRRLQGLFREVDGLLRELRPAAISLEDLFVHREFPRAAIALGQAQGVIWLAAAAHRVPVVALAPGAVKRAVTGSGRASKAQVQAAVRTLLGVRRVADPHAADALALAYAGLHRLRGRA